MIKDKLVNHFVSASIRTSLETKRLYFLNLGLEALNIEVNYDDQDQENVDSNPASRTPEETNSSSSNTDKSNHEQASSQLSAAPKKTVTSAARINEEDDSEAWLYHYMLGKIKEKLNGVNVMDSLDHYYQSLKILEKNKATYLKKITQKTKGNLSLESNEVTDFD